MVTAKQLLYIFILAFTLNFVWEHFHSLLYVHYKGEEITSLILTRAALFDASFTTVLASPFILFNFLKRRIWVMVLVATLFAIGLEIFALQTGRWEYKDIMPIIPFVNVGLTPTVQLGFLGYISFVVSNTLIKRR